MKQCNKKSCPIDEFEKKVVDALYTNHGNRNFIDLLNKIVESGNVGVDFDYSNKQITLSYDGDEESSSVDGADAFAAIMSVISIVQNLEKRGLVVLYQLNNEKNYIWGNANAVNNAKTKFLISNTVPFDYINKEIIVVEQKMKDYVDRGYLFPKEYYVVEMLKGSNENLKVSKVSMIISVLIFVLTVIIKLCH